MSAKLFAISLKITVQNTKILFEQFKYKNKPPWYLNSITSTNWMRVFLGVSCLFKFTLDALFSYHRARTWYCSWLSSTLTLHLAYKPINPEKFFFAEIIGSPRLGFKTTLKYWFYCLGLGKHNNAWTVKQFSSESSHTELIADKVYSSKLLAQNIVNDHVFK